jgi:hypothetical protein
MRLSAYSTTTMAPSTSIPTARIRPNITMFDTATPITARSAKAQQERGRDRKAHQQRRARAQAASTTIITSAMAVRTEPSSWLTMEATRGSGRSRCHLTACLQFFGGQVGLGLGHGLADQRGGVDDVEALALDHLQRDRRLAVEARGADAVLEGQVDLGQIAQRDHPVAVGLDGQVIDVARLVEGGRDLDRKGAGSVSTSPAAISWLLFCTTLISSPR